MIPDKIELNKTIVNKIVEIRGKLGLSSYQLSEKMGKSKFWLNNVENNKTKNISKDDLVNILSYIYDERNEIENTIEKLISETNYESSEIELILPKSEKETVNYDLMYNNVKEEIIKGFDDIYMKIEDKEKIIKVFKNINNNIHSNLGFSFSLFNLPWCRFSNLSPDGKSEIIDKLFEFIKTNGHECSECNHCKNKPELSKDKEETE